MSELWPQLEHAVLHGPDESLVEALTGRSEPELRAVRSKLAGLARGRAEDGVWWQDRRAHRCVAAQVVCDTPAGAAKRLRRDGWMVRPDRGAAMSLLAVRDREWRTSLYRALLELETPETWDVTEALRLDLGEPYPRTDAYLTGLAWRVSLGRDAGVLASLRADEGLRAVVPDLLAVDRIGPSLSHDTDYVYGPGPQGPQKAPRGPERTWAGALRIAADEGLLERETLVSTTVRVLVRGGRPADLAFFVRLLDTLDLTPDEVVAHRSELLRLLVDGGGSSAAKAQKLLRGAFDRDALDVDDLLEASRSVVLRREKALVAAQLRWLARVGRRAPTRRRDVALVASAAFGHDRVDLQEQAIGVVATWWGELDRAVVAEIEERRRDLAPSARAEADRLLGKPSDASATGTHAPSGAPPDRGTTSAVDALPPYVRRPGPQPVQDLEDIADVASQQLEVHTGMLDEVLLDGVLRLAAGHRDRLRELVEPLLPRVGELATVSTRYDVAPGLALLLEVAGPERSGWRQVLGGRPSAQSYRGARAQEVADAVRRGESRRLLALPTYWSGLVDPAALGERLRDVADVRVEALRGDLETALVRLPRGTTRTDLEPLPTGPVGEHVRAWFEQSFDEPVTYAVVARRTSRWREEGGDVRVAEVAVRPQGPSLVRAACQPGAATEHAVKPWYERWAGLAGWSPLSLPAYRDVAAVWIGADLVDLHTRGGGAGLVATLGWLAEADGPLGVATALVLARGLGAKDPSVRTASGDALDVLVRREELPVEALGAEIVELVGRRELSIQRCAPVLATVAVISAPHAAEVYRLLARVVPPLLRAGTRDVALLVDVAAECAAAAPVGEVIGGVADVAAKGGSTKLAGSARRLVAAVR